MGAINKVPSVHFLGNKSSFPLKNGTLVAVVSVVADVDAGAFVDADVNAADVVDGGSTLGEAANSC